MHTEQVEDRAELFGDESDSDLDPKDHEMIDSGTTHIEVRVEGGSQTITIVENHDLLKNTEDVVHAFSSFCFDVEHGTLEELSDSTLSKSIVGLALRVNHFIYFFSLLLIFCFGSLSSFYLLTLFPLTCRQLS